ncbi:MAG: hypothetical protein RBT04_08700 [Sphaerochaetaceae bacterium]|jgi:hypothetical protein|nr:hypothetical protein [Sphaerochaetaceae bacterium]
MARTLTIRKGSSPSYTFTITDVEGSGLNIDSEEYGVGMTISNGKDTVWTVAPKTVGGRNVEDYLRGSTTTNIVFLSNTLCRKISTETTTRFIVTLPITITNQFDVSDEYTYEAFLLGIKTIESSSAIIYNIPIDSGTVNVVDSYIPINFEPMRRSALTVV